MTKLISLFTILFVLVACQKELPETLNSGEYVWVHAYNSENESESFQTSENTYSIKIKGNGAYKIYMDGKKVNSGKFDLDDFSSVIVFSSGTEHSFSYTEDRIDIWGYPFSNHKNTFLKI